MQRDNIKNLAYAAFRQYGHRKSIDTMDVDDITAIMAVRVTIEVLKLSNDRIAIEGVEKVFFTLPMGDVKNITERVKSVANEMHVDISTLWRHIRRARKIFEECYDDFVAETCDE